ncbi:MAG: sensor histidine kinase [Haloarcula sp.]
MAPVRGSVHLVVGTDVAERVSDLTDELATVSAESVSDPRTARERIEAGDGDIRSVVISDSDNYDGLDVFERLRALDETIPIVLVAVEPDPDRVEAALTAGVTDYVAVDMPAPLLAARLEAYAKRWPPDWRAGTEQWDDISSGISHDAKNPLNVVMGRLDLLDLDGPHAEPLRRSVKRVESLLSDLSCIGSIACPVTDPEQLSLADVAREVWSMADRDGATLEVTTEATVDAELDRLELLFQELFDNAHKHGESPVTVTVGDTGSGFYVADDGPGIPESDLGEVFKQGFGTTRDGEGYGLFLVATAARAHGWTVAVSDSQAGGARIEVTVP